MEEAAEAVKSWWEEIEAYQQLRSLRSRLITRLSNRAADQQVEGEEGGSLAAYTRREGDAGGVDRIPANAMSDDQLLDAISNLIDFERQMMQSRQLQVRETFLKACVFGNDDTQVSEPQRRSSFLRFPHFTE